MASVAKTGGNGKIQKDSHLADQNGAVFQRLVHGMETHPMRPVGVCRGVVHALGVARFETALKDCLELPFDAAWVLGQSVAMVFEIVVPATMWVLGHDGQRLCLP